MSLFAIFSLAACIFVFCILLVQTRRKIKKLRGLHTYAPSFGGTHETGLAHPRVQSMLKLPGPVVLLVCLHEDDRFFIHSGFNVPELFQSLKTLLTGQALKGGSSITQQLVKNVFALKGRTLRRKIVEAYITILVEHTFTKEEILALYLDNIRLHWMDDSIGFSSAAIRYFNKSIDNLSTPEILFLCNLIPKPSVLSYNICRQGRIDEFPYTHVQERLIDYMRFVVSRWGPSILNNPSALSYDAAVLSLREYHAFRQNSFDRDMQLAFEIRSALEIDDLIKAMKNLVDPLSDELSTDASRLTQKVSHWEANLD